MSCFTASISCVAYQFTAPHCYQDVRPSKMDG